MPSWFGELDLNQVHIFSNQEYCVFWYDLIADISSAVLYIAPARLDEACEALRQMPGVEIHAQTTEGKVVVTLEGDDTNSAADSYVALHGIAGVASVAMIYQYSGNESDNEEGMV
jgi:periplasmic nitrate reductase NapD